MNETDFKTAVIDLKQEIRRQVFTALLTFKKRTNITPSAVKLDMYDATTQDDEGLRDYVLGAVYVEFKL